MRWLALALVLGASGAAHSATPPASCASCRATAAGRFHRPRVTESSTTCCSTRPSRSRRPRQQARARRDPRPSSKQPRIAGSGATYARRRAPATTHVPALDDAGDTSVFFFHAERHEEPRGRSIFDFTRPKALIYANAPGKPLVLVGAMWSTRDGEVGPTPAGPILRWHSHVVCKAGEEARAEASGERRLPSGLTTPAGRERDAPRLVHGRPAQRVRDHRSASRSCAPRVASCPRDYCQAAVARAISRGTAPLSSVSSRGRPREAARPRARCSSSMPPQIRHAYAPHGAIDAARVRSIAPVGSNVDRR